MQRAIVSATGYSECNGSQCNGLLHLPSLNEERCHISGLSAMEHIAQNWDLYVIYSGWPEQ